MSLPEKNRATLEDLLDILVRLRDREHGCPWDAAQDFASIAPYTIEEAYEVADAIDRGDLEALCEELGDLLLQVVFHARIAEEAGAFSFADVVAGICAKLVRRHPHVFPDATGHLQTVASAAEQTRAWQEQKRRERAAKEPSDPSLLAGIPRGLPEWLRALQLQRRAASIGFDWSEPEPVLDKLAEELAEVRAELRAGADPERLEDEIGDVLFVGINLARLAGVDYSAALRRANAKFERRFRRMEQLAAADGTTLAGKSLVEQDAYWLRAKAEERGSPP
jgi:ATP diphosphatase